MIRSISIYLRGPFPVILLCLLLVQCSEKSQTQSSEEEKSTDPKARYQVVDEIPPDILDIKNVSVFPADSQPTHSLELIPEQSFGKEGEPYLTKIQQGIVDDNERVIILNSGTNYAQQVYVYNSDGSFHTKIGRAGRGPGEYSFAMSMQAQPGKVFLNDIPNKRLNIYNTDDYTIDKTLLEEQLNIREHEAVQGLEFGMYNAINNGNYLVGFYERVSDTGWPMRKFLLMGPNGNALDYNTQEFRGGFKANGKVKSEMGPVPMSFMPMGFMGSSVETVTDKGELYMAWNMNFLIRKYDTEGVYQSAIYYPVVGSPFDIDEHTPTAFYNKDDVMDALDIHDEELPEDNPVIRRLQVDDEGRIWVAIPAGDERTMNEWWILSDSGQLIARSLFTGDKEIQEIKGGYLYTKETNEETGTDYIMKYRMKWTEN